MNVEGSCHSNAILQVLKENQKHNKVEHGAPFELNIIWVYGSAIIVRWINAAVYIPYLLGYKYK